MRNIYIYKDETESQVQQFFENADEKLRNNFKSILNYLSNDKNPLCEPYVKHISIGRYRELYEIRNRQKQAQTECAFYANLVWAFVIICKIYDINAI